MRDPVNGAWHPRPSAMPEAEHVSSAVGKGSLGETSARESAATWRLPGRAVLERQSPGWLQSRPGPTAAPLAPQGHAGPPLSMGNSGWSGSRGAAPWEHRHGLLFPPVLLSTDPNCSRSRGGDLGAACPPSPPSPAGTRARHRASLLRGVIPELPIPWGTAPRTAGLRWPQPAQAATRKQSVPGRGWGRCPRRHQEHGMGTNGGVQRYREHCTGTDGGVQRYRE